MLKRRTVRKQTSKISFGLELKATLDNKLNHLGETVKIFDFKKADIIYDEIYAQISSLEGISSQEYQEFQLKLNITTTLYYLQKSQVEESLVFARNSIELLNGKISPEFQVENFMLK